MTNEPPIISFKNQSEFESWLNKSFEKKEGIWLKFYKRGSGIETVSYAEALDVALCYGWIDGQAKTYDEKSYLQKFTPRRSKSIWSKRNREHVARLTSEGRMQPSGLAEVKKAKKDGRWESAYDSPANTKIPKDFLNELRKYPQAYEFFQKLNKTNTYAIAWGLQTAKKPETREKRLQKFIGMMKEGKRLY